MLVVCELQEHANAKSNNGLYPCLYLIPADYSVINVRKNLE